MSIPGPTGKPTEPPKIDDNGFVLDAWGLPVSGPRRRAVLAEMARRDPRDFPEDWQQPARAALNKAKDRALGTDEKENSNG